MPGIWPPHPTIGNQAGVQGKLMRLGRENDEETLWDILKERRIGVPPLVKTKHLDEDLVKIDVLESIPKFLMKV